LNPEDAQAFYNRGTASLKNGNTDNAINDFNKAIELDPSYALAYYRIAWLRATCPNSKYRDGNDAVFKASKACELTQWKHWHFLETLAAGYAEQGDFEKAIKWQAAAIELAATESEKKDSNARFEIYKAGKPYRDELRKPRQSVDP